MYLMIGLLFCDRLVDGIKDHAVVGHLEPLEKQSVRHFWEHLGICLPGGEFIQKDAFVIGCVRPLQPPLEHLFDVEAVQPADGQLLAADLYEFGREGFDLGEGDDVAAVDADKGVAGQGFFEGRDRLFGDDGLVAGDDFYVIADTFNIEDVVEGDLDCFAVGAEVDEGGDGSGCGRSGGG